MKSCALFTNFVRVAVAAALLTTQILPAENLRGTSAVDLLIQKAHSLEGRDRDDLAAQVWQQVLIANPNQPEALVGLARWAKRAGKNLLTLYKRLERLRSLLRDCVTRQLSPSA